MASLKDKYNKEVVPKLKEVLGFKNINQVPKISKVVVNMGIGIVDKDALQIHTADLAAITGQKPSIRKAKKSISNFKLREGMSIGAVVTLRGRRMYEFLDRLINAALPRIRDFRGVSPNSFDGSGNYTLGVKEIEIFPEIDPNKVVNKGMDITIVTTAEENKHALELLKMLGMPFAGQ